MNKNYLAAHTHTLSSGRETYFILKRLRLQHKISKLLMWKVQKSSIKEWEAL